MAKLRVADFYYGSVLSMLFNSHIVPALVEGNEERQIYDLATNSGDYRLIVKYRTKSRRGVDSSYRSWHFNFPSEDIEEMMEYIEHNPNMLLALICGEEGLNDSEFAVLNSDDIRHCLGAGKSSLTVSRAKGEKAFRIPVGGRRDNSLKIPYNRLIE